MRKITQKMADAFINNEDARQANARVEVIVKFASWMDDYAREDWGNSWSLFAWKSNCLDE